MTAFALAPDCHPLTDGAASPIHAFTVVAILNATRSHVNGIAKNAKMRRACPGISTVAEKCVAPYLTAFMNTLGLTR